MPSLDSISAKRYRNGILFPALGLDRETAPSLWLMIVGVILVATGIYFTHGNVIAAAATLVLPALVIITFYRLDVSLYILMGSVLLFDQFKIDGLAPITLQIDYFRNLKAVSYLPSFDAGVVTPMEVHLLLMVLAFFILNSIKNNYELKRVPAWGAALLFFGWFVFSFVRGMSLGGQFLTALWEVRAIFYLGLLYFLVPQIIRTRKQLNILLWVMIGAITVKAMQGIYRFASFGFSFGGFQTLTNHEDPVFINILFIFMFALLLYNSKSRQKSTLLFLFPILFAGSYVSQRRAAYAAFIVLCICFISLLSWKYRWFVLKLLFPLLIVIGAYFAVGWNSNASWASPVKMIKSGVKPLDKSEMSRQDYLSNLYRLSENYNLASTVEAQPIFGTGFGKQYLQPVSLANIRFSLKNYIPHNQIFWIIVKTGSVGFFLFWFFLNAFSWNAVKTFVRLKDPYLKSVCLAITLVVINQMVVSYFDLQLTYYRNMTFLGIWMGLLPTIQNLHSKKGADHEIGEFEESDSGEFMGEYDAFGRVQSLTDTQQSNLNSQPN